MPGALQGAFSPVLAMLGLGGGGGASGAEVGQKAMMRGAVGGAASAGRDVDPRAAAQRIYQALPDEVKAFARQQAQMEYQAMLADRLGLRPGDSLGRVAGKKR